MSGADRTRRVAQILALSSAIALGCGRPHFPGYVIQPVEPETPPGEELALPVPESPDSSRRCHRILAIEIHKAERSLIAQCADGEPIRLRAAMGRDSNGAKERQGDMKTPEGAYRVAGPPRASRFHLFLPIDYPGEHDAERALRLGIISEQERDEIVAAREAERLPPQGTRLGGNLGLHGEGPRWQGDSHGLNWTQGCVGLADRDIEFLSTRVSTGTPVLILP